MFVDKGNAGNPVAGGDPSVALDIVLTTGKIPHEVAPVHIVDLVTEQEFQVVEEGGFLIPVGDAILTFVADDVISERGIIRVGMHPGEQHCIGIFVNGSGRFFIPLFFFRIVFNRFAIGSAFADSDGRTVGTPGYFGSVGGSVEMGDLTVLFTVEHAPQREDVLGRVEVEWRIGTGANWNQHIYYRRLYRCCITESHYLQQHKRFLSIIGETPSK